MYQRLRQSVAQYLYSNISLGSTIQEISKLVHGLSAARIAEM
jgi:hypothetical protein